MTSSPSNKKSRFTKPNKQRQARYGEVKAGALHCVGNGCRTDLRAPVSFIISVPRPLLAELEVNGKINSDTPTTYW